MASFPLVGCFCFICGESARGSGQMLLKRKSKKDKHYCDNFVSLHETHGILLKLLLSLRRKEESHQKDSLRNYASISHDDDLFVELQPKVGTMISPNPIQFCERCDQLAKHVRKLYLELEVLQMRIVDELKRTRELVVTRNLETLNEDITREQSDQENDGFQNIIGRFQSFVKENDVTAESIPLVYLGSRLPKFIPAQLMNLQAEGELASDTLIKQEIPDVDNHADDAYNDDSADDDGYNQNDDCNVKLETPNEIVRKGSKRKRRLLTRQPLPPIKIESTLVTGRRSAAMRASTLIKIATTRQPPRCPKRSKIRTEAQLLAHKIQAEAKKRRLEKRKLGILRPRLGGQEKEKQCCGSCGFEVRSRHSFEQHLRSHEDADKEKPFECPDCKQRFVQRQYFEYHLTLHTRVRRVKCDICEELVFPVDIKEHHLTLHGKAYPCEYCTHCFGSAISLALHCYNHTTSNMTCEDCSPPKVIKGNRAFLRHLAEVHDHKDLLISCEYPSCAEKYLLSERALHLDSHKRNRDFVCHHCGKNFVTKADCNFHIKNTHEKERCTKICDLCGEKFPQKWQLEAHRVSKHNFPSKFKCDVCPGKYFLRKSRLVKHNLSNHTPESEWPFSCTIEGCRKRYISKEALTTHLQHHGSERPFKCDVCGHTTKTQKMLHKHAQVHTDVRNHACPHCRRRFREKSQLTDHIRLHTGERPFLCAVCGASYKQRGQLYHHKKKHQSDDASFPSPPQTKSTSGESGSGLTPSKETYEEQELSQQ